MKKIIVSVVCLFAFSGCSQMALDAGSKQLENRNLKDDATYMCYDWINKKECPEQLMQLDIDILPYIMGDSRFCIGFTEIVTIPDGMNCFYKNLF